MAKKEQMLRLKLIEQFLRRRRHNGASYEEIRDYLARKYQEKDIVEEKLKFTKRTFLRDKETLMEIFGVEISYRRATNTYVIDADETDVANENVFDNLLLVEAYREVKGRKDVMIFEQRVPRGLQWLHGLLHAITNQKIITLDYTKFYDGITSRKVLEPYALKEFRNRWYLLANERRGQAFQLKIFGLDRISELDISSSSFKTVRVDISDFFRNSFGIISTDCEEPEDIILSFDAEQGKYIKTLPLHHSQEIVRDDEHEFCVKLSLVPTYDFERELLSHGSRVRVIQPVSLQERLKTEMAQMLNFYTG